MKQTTIKITVITPSGEPYEGAIIKAFLANSFFVDGVYVNSNEHREYTNSYGVAELELVPSTLDSSGENFYHIDIVYDTVVSKKYIVPESETVLFLNQLEEYKYPYERIDFIGECDTRF